MLYACLVSNLNHMRKRKSYNSWQNSTFHRTFTSSTAQGCGGSFKNRKPIGRVGCCDSRMAERIH